MSGVEGMVHLTHPETGGETLVPDDEGVVAMFAARGWQASDAVPPHLDPEALNTGALPELGTPAPADEALEAAAVDDPAPAGDDPVPPTTEAAVAEVTEKKESARG